jgi:hypothetical protein
MSLPSIYSFKIGFFYLKVRNCHSKTFHRVVFYDILRNSGFSSIKNKTHVLKWRRSAKIEYVFNVNHASDFKIEGKNVIKLEINQR